MTRTILAVTTLAALVACASSPPPASPPQPAAKAAASPARLTYRIVEVSDTSALGAKRFVYRVRVSRPVSEAEVRAMSRRIIAKVTLHDGMDIFFYLPDTNVQWAYTAARAEW